VVTKAVDGYPQRVVMTAMIQALESATFVTRLPRAFLNAMRLRKLTDTTFGDLIAEGLAMRKGGRLTWAQLAMAANAPLLTKASLVDGKPESGVLPTGQVVGVIDELPAVADLIAEIVAEAEEALARLQISPSVPQEASA
jgi:NAD(P)H-dependent flavin oxidoreductase YrpB (nitropropane dioxygenase family)